MAGTTGSNNVQQQHIYLQLFTKKKKKIKIEEKNLDQKFFVYSSSMMDIHDINELVCRPHCHTNTRIQKTAPATFLAEATTNNNIDLYLHINMANLLHLEKITILYTLEVYLRVYIYIYTHSRLLLLLLPIRWKCEL